MEMTEHASVTPSRVIANTPGTLDEDPWLEPFLDVIHNRVLAVRQRQEQLTGGELSLADFASAHEYFGLHRDGQDWVFREWAPNADVAFLIGEFSDWREDNAFRLQRRALGQWELRLPPETLRHGMLYRLRLGWYDGEGDRVPAYARRVVQDSETGIFNAQVWVPAEPYEWRHESPPPPDSPYVYESHVGMAQEDPRVGTYDEFRRHLLPRIKAAGYNSVQLMAIQEHPYYGSFGYHVSNFFAAASRFGTPDEFKALVDEAHGLGLRVIIDLVHSHAARNEAEGLARFDGTQYQYFHAGERGWHVAWDSCCFNYGKPEVLHFLLSNCRFWLDEYRVDGFRFDGITSMMYKHHGLGHTFSGYWDYFGEEVDEDALVYLALANRVVHQVRDDATTVAEDVSGMPGLAAPIADGGIGFDYRLALGVTDMWFRMLDIPDENWNLEHIWHELLNRRRDERTISYVECHDQAIVGGQTLIFRLLRNAMYDAMHAASLNLDTERGIALHKIIRLMTAATAGHGYLNFMGNEFGHPEWVDFPREDNDWSYHHARRLWSLRDDETLRYHFLADFDKAMLELLQAHRILSQARPQQLAVNEQDHVIAFERNGLFFFVNLDPATSYEHYAVETLPGSYVHVMDTDEERFGGHGRLTSGQTHETFPERMGSTIRHMIRLYLPCRTVLILQRRAPAEAAASRI